MRCDQFEDLLQQQLDARLAPSADESLRLHARQCPACAAVLASYEGLLRGVAEMPQAAAPSDLAARVVAQLAEGDDAPRLIPASVESRRQQRRVNLVAALVALAAVMLLSMPLLWLVQRQRQAAPSTERQVATDQDRNDTNTPQATTAVSQKRRPRPLDVLVGALARETQQSVTGAMQILPSVSSSPNGGQLAAADPGALDEPAAEEESMAETLRPLTNSTASAIGTLWQIVPEPLEEPSS